LFSFVTATRFSCDAIIIELLLIDSTYRGMLVTPQLAEVFVSARILYKFAKGFDGRPRQLSSARRGAHWTRVLGKLAVSKMSVIEKCQFLEIIGVAGIVGVLEIGTAPTKPTCNATGRQMQRTCLITGIAADAADLFDYSCAF
jgi:hypothetical protein